MPKPAFLMSSNLFPKMMVYLASAPRSNNTSERTFTFTGNYSLSAVQKHCLERQNNNPSYGSRSVESTHFIALSILGTK